YREDYARGGFKMLSITEPTGVLTSLCAVLYTLLLLPLNMTLVRLHHAGIPFAVASTLLTIGMLILAIRFALTPTHLDAPPLSPPPRPPVLPLDPRTPNDLPTQSPPAYVLPSVSQ